MPDELCYLSIAEAAPLLKSRQLSPVESIDAFLHRIVAIDFRTHSFVLVTREEALRQAKAAETEIAAGVRLWGPMHGIPIGLKDLIETAGIRLRPIPGSHRSFHRGRDGRQPPYRSRLRPIG